MLIRLGLLLVIVPLLEMVLLLTLADVMGFTATLATVILTGVAGAWLLRHQGLRTITTIMGELRGGRLPGRELMDGALLLVAGALLLTPGLLTDLVGLALLIPLTRSWCRAWLAQYFRSRWQIRTSGPDGSSSTPTQVIDSYVVRDGAGKKD